MEAIMSEQLEPRRTNETNEVDITKVSYSKVEQPGPKGFFTQLQGFWVTFVTQFKKVNTVEYPEVKEPTAERFHGRHQLNRHPDGLEKCIG